MPGVVFEALTGTLSINSGPWTSGLDGAMRKFEAFTLKVSEVVDKVTTAATVALAGVGSLAAGLTKLASDAEEAASKFEVVFKSAADRTRESLDKFSGAVGRSKFELRSFAADIGALLGGMNLADDTLGAMSANLTKLAVDLSSFHNVSEREALGALRSALAGETEPMKRLGVIINEVAIQQEAYRLKLAKTKEEVVGANKAQAVYSLIIQQTAQAQGDAARTKDGFANSMRAFQAAVKDAATDLGKTLLPAATTLTNRLREQTRQLYENSGALREWVETALSAERINEAFDRLEERANKVWESFDRLGKAMSERLKPTVEFVSLNVDRLKKGIDDLWSSIPTGVRDVITVTGTLTGLSVVLSSIGGKIPIIGGAIASLAGLLNPFTVLGTVLSVIGTTVSWLTSLFNPWVAAIGVVVGGIWFLVDAVDRAIEVNGELGSVFESFQGILDGAIDLFWRAVDGVKGLALALGDELSKWLVVNRDDFERLRVKIGELILQARDFALTVWDRLKPAFAAIAIDTGVLRAAFNGLLFAVKLFITGVETAIDALAGRTDRINLVLTGVQFGVFGLIRSILDRARYVVRLLPWWLGGGEDNDAKLKNMVTAIDAQMVKLSNRAMELSNKIAADDKARADKIRAADEKAEQDRLARQKQSQDQETVKQAASAFGDVWGRMREAFKNKAIENEVASKTTAMEDVKFKPMAPGLTPEQASAKHRAYLMGLSPNQVQQNIHGLADKTGDQIADLRRQDLSGLKDASGKNARADEDLRSLVIMRRQMLEFWNTVKNSSGDARAEALDKLKELETSYGATYERIQKKIKGTYDKAAEEAEKSAKRQEKAAGDVEKKINETSERKSTTADGKSTGAKGGGPAQQFINSMGFAQQVGMQLMTVFNQAATMIGLAGVQFAQVMEQAASPMEKLDLAIQNVSARLGAAQINARNFGGSLAAVVSLQKELDDLGKRRQEAARQEARDRLAAEQQSNEEFARQRRIKAAREAEADEDRRLQTSALVSAAGGQVVNVTINSHDIRDTASKLTEELRRQGVDVSGKRSPFAKR